MALSHELISQFAKIVKEDKKKSSESTVYGTVVTDGNGNKYVKLDGSDQLTPLSDDERPSADTATSSANEGERVSVLIKDHTATVTGNISSPAVRTGDFNNLNDQVTDIKKFDIVIAEKVQANEGYIKSLQADKAEVGDLTAATARITELETKKANVEDLTAAKAEITDLKTTKLDADVANTKYATIESLTASDAKITDLTAKTGEFEDLATNKFTAIEADIQTLDAEKISTTTADAKYANIDFGNITEAAVEKLFTESGIIKDLIVSEGHITGELVGVTIKGDIIEGGTVKADKLVILGEDGLYYKLNANSLGEATASSDPKYQNGLDGSVIVANSITAEKVNVNDLVAFDATIGGFNITDNAIYSGVKESVGNTARGIYLDKNGQFSVGDSSNYFRYYNDGGTYKLEISAKSIKLSSSGTDIENEINNINTTVEDLNANFADLNENVDSYYYDAQYSKNGNLVKNGYGEYLDNTGFVSTTFTRGDCPDGCYGYFNKGRADERISFNKNLIYKYEYYCRIHTGIASGNAYFGIIPYDVDGKAINRQYILDYNKNLFYLSQDLNDGDTVVHFTDLSNWNISTTATSERSFLIFGYEDSTGYVYPDGTYSRNYYNSIYSSDDSVDTTNNTITLSSAWTGGLIEAGTCIGQTTTGQSFLPYGQDGTITNTDWQKWSGTLKADPNGDQKERRLAYAKEILVTFYNKIADFAGIYIGQQAVDDAARNTANDAQLKANEIGAKLEILENSVLTLVKDENGQTSLAQDSSGWTFSITDTENKINDASNSISAIQTSLNGTSDETGIIQKLDILNDSVTDLNKLSNYIKITTVGDQPCIELGSDISDFKVLITNTDIKFMEGSSVPAFISNESLNIGKANIKDELKQGGFVWRARGENGNGNLGLIWKGSDT